MKPAKTDQVRGLAGRSASHQVDQRIAALGGWRRQTLSRMRKLICQTHSGIREEVKWRGTPVWSLGGIICTGESYAHLVKLTFAKGASIPDPSRLFNSSLKGRTRRAIDIREGEKIDPRAFKELIRAAVKLNSLKRVKAGTITKKSRTVKLLAGGNPQIPKGEGCDVVREYIAAMPGWKRDVGKELDALIVKHVPKVRKAVKWNSPLYGIEGHGWFLSFRVFTRYVKVTFFAGNSLRPRPPGGTDRSKEARWIDIYEMDSLDGRQLATWIKQAAALPGWMP